MSYFSRQAFANDEDSSSSESAADGIKFDGYKVTETTAQMPPQDKTKYEEEEKIKPAVQLMSLVEDASVTEEDESDETYNNPDNNNNNMNNSNINNSIESGSAYEDCDLLSNYQYLDETVPAKHCRNNKTLPQPQTQTEVQPLEFVLPSNHNRNPHSQRKRRKTRHCRNSKGQFSSKDQFNPQNYARDLQTIIKREQAKIWKATQSQAFILLATDSGIIVQCREEVLGTEVFTKHVPLSKLFGVLLEDKQKKATALLVEASQKKKEYEEAKEEEKRLQQQLNELESSKEEIN